MSHLLVHDMDTAWSSSNAALLQVSSDNQTFMGAGAASNRLAAPAGAQLAFAEFAPGVALDLGAFEELRFWTLASRPANGSAAAPFFLEFSYTDAGDGPNEEHCWLVPVDQKDQWESHRIGIVNDRRTAVTGFRFTCLTDHPFVCFVDELLAVREEMMADMEEALFATLDGQIALPGVANVLLNQNAASPTTQIRLPLSPGFQPGNRILIVGGSAGDQIHEVITAQHDTGAGNTTLFFATMDPVIGSLTAGVAAASVLVPVIPETMPTLTSTTTPALLVSLLDVQEDLARTPSVPQRDSFRRRGALTACSVREPARAYLADYQILPVAPDRAQEMLLRTLLLQRLSMDQGLRINGQMARVWMLPPPMLFFRHVGQSASVYVRIGTRMETAPRREENWVRRLDVAAAQVAAPLDQEGIALNL